MRRRVAAAILFLCGFFLLITWVNPRKELLTVIWENPNFLWTTNADVAMKIAGLALLAAGLLVLPRD